MKTKITLAKITCWTVVLCTPLLAQYHDNTPSMKCSDGSEGSSRWSRYCEMREQTIPYAGQLTIDGGANGGVAVKGWNRSEVLVRMKIDSNSESESTAKSLASQVQLVASAGRIAA